MAVKHTTIKAPGQQLFAVLDWNADHNIEDSTITAAKTTFADQDVKTTSSPSFVKATLTQAIGTAPLTITSTTKCTNLNADMVDGKHDSDFDAAGAASSAVSNHESTYDHDNLPTDDEKDALAGTDGTPSSLNPYVTDSDPRLSAGLPQVLVNKNNEESVTSSTTLQDDDELYLTLPVGTYTIEARLELGNSQGGGFKWRWKPGEADGIMRCRSSHFFPESGVTIENQQGLLDYVHTYKNANGYVIINAIFQVTTPGDLIIQWAQQKSSGVSTIVRAGSWLKASTAGGNVEPEPPAWNFGDSTIDAFEDYLAHYWPMEDNTDKIGIATLTAINAPTYDAGKHNNALTCESAGSKALRSANQGDDLVSCQDRVLTSLWLKCTSTGITGIIDQYDTSGGAYSCPALEYNGGFLRYTIWGEDHANHSQATIAFTPSSDWHHVVTVAEYTTGAGGNWFARIYLDGVAGTDGSTIENTTSVPEKDIKYTTFGCVNDSGESFYRFLDGQIDEVATWFGIVFPTKGYTEEDMVAALYNAGDGKFLNWS